MIWSGSWFRPILNQNRTILNRTDGPVLGSQKYLEEPDRTEPYHPYAIQLPEVAANALATLPRERLRGCCV